MAKDKDLAAEATLEQLVALVKAAQNRKHVGKTGSWLEFLKTRKQVCHVYLQSFGQFGGGRPLTVGVLHAPADGRHGPETTQARGEYMSLVSDVWRDLGKSRGRARVPHFGLSLWRRLPESAGHRAPLSSHCGTPTSQLYKRPHLLCCLQVLEAFVADLVDAEDGSGAKEAQAAAREFTDRYLKWAKDVRKVHTPANGHTHISAGAVWVSQSARLLRGLGQCAQGQRWVIAARADTGGGWMAPGRYGT